MPKLRNVPVDAAVASLHRAGLRFEIPSRWAIHSFDEPLAFLLSPDTGTHVPAGSVVSLRIGQILGSPGQPLGRHVVPDVHGERLDQATKQISAAKLPWSVRATALPPTSTTDLFSAYCVASQTPSSGTAVAVGTSSHQIREVELQAKPC